MKKDEIVDLFLLWKGVEWTHNLKSFSKLFLIILSLVFSILSFFISNLYILIISLIILFLQLLSENNKEFYLKLKEIYNNIHSSEDFEKYKNWIKFLERTTSICFILKWFLRKYYKKEINKILTNEK